MQFFGMMFINADLICSLYVVEGSLLKIEKIKLFGKVYLQTGKNAGL